MPNIVTFPFPDRPSTEEQINQVIPILNYLHINNRELSGFSGDCWAAAYAINKVIFNSEAQVIAALNEAAYLHANRSLGHVAVHYLTDEQGTDFIDMKGFKDSELIESWGMLAPDDYNYIELFEENNVALTDEAFYNVTWVSYSMEEIEELIDSEILNDYVNGFENAKKQVFPPAKKLKIK